MGSYSELYIGDSAMSWKYYVPDVLGLLFEVDDYRSFPLSDELLDPEDDTYYEHQFHTTCGQARSRLATLGIDTKFLRAVHDTWFSFDYDWFLEQFDDRTGSYIYRKYGKERGAKLLE